MDMTNGLYRLRGTDWVIPYGDFKVPATDESNWDLILSRGKHLDRAFLEWFRDHFEFEGGLSEQGFRDNLEWLCRQISPDSQLILINGAEVDFDHPFEIDRAAPSSTHERDRRRSG